MQIPVADELRAAIIDRLTIQSPISIVLVGSVAEGLSNSLSDVDIYAILSDSRHDSCRVEFFEVGDTTVDVEYLSVVEIQSTISRIMAVAKTALTAPREAAQISEQDVLIVHRLINGHYLAGGEELRKILGEQVQDALARVLVAKSTVLCTAAHLDMAGLLAEHRMLESLLAARRLVDWAYLAYIAGRGRTNPSVKWRYRQLTMISNRHPVDRPLIDIYSQIMRLDLAKSDEEVRSIVRKSVWVSALLIPVANAELTGKKIMDSAADVAAGLTPTLDAQIHWRTYARLVDGNPVLGRVGNQSEIVLSWDGFLRSLALLRPRDTGHERREPVDALPVGGPSTDLILQIFNSHGLLEIT